jgi:hypothetical protein
MIAEFAADPTEPPLSQRYEFQGIAISIISLGLVRSWTDLSLFPQSSGSLGRYSRTRIDTVRSPFGYQVGASPLQSFVNHRCS